ncbi:MAG: flagellar biosynthesis protein FlhB [Methylococcaceae bacterium]|nr:flagellar biosynthesis protein FlhB [Methylococcaceae bacterium]
MAEDSGQDKSEEPTGKRISDARKKGQIARSKELDTFVSLMTGAIMLMFLGEGIVEGLIVLMKQQFQISRELIFDPNSTVLLFDQVLLDGILLIFPFGIVMMVMALIRPMMMGGWNVSMEAMQPKLSKFNPMKGLKRMFGMQGVVELLKAILKTSLILFVAKILYDIYLPEFMDLSNESVNSAIYHTADILIDCLLVLSSTLFLLVMIDVPYQLWKYKKDMMMTKQEVKDEHKDSDGNPQVKGRIRQLQMAMAQGRMMSDVPEADVVVTNPAHFAVALKYDPSGSGAPVVVAKGTDLIAAQIRNIAMGAEVPLVAVPPLARALYYSTEIGEEIPAGLFLVVAQVLAYIFQLKAAKTGFGERPSMPTGLKVPEEFRQS